MDTHRAIIHSDMNSFYASVEQAENPSLRGLPVAVGGDVEARHGIVLAASREAKACGVRTAQALWEARRCCPEVVFVPPHYGLYRRYSLMARSIYNEYTDLVEPFGPDEAWLDVTGSAHLFGGDAQLVAREVSERVKSELGVSVSVGVSWNKIFAKWGSDHDKPDGFMVVAPETAGRQVWPRPVGDLLYVGPATEAKLARVGVVTVGQLAQADPLMLRRMLGLPGLMVQRFARGEDDSPVRPLDASAMDVEREVKTVGNGVTSPFDVEDARTMGQLAWLLGESVAQRLRALGMEARVAQVTLRDGETLACLSRQATLPRPTDITGELCHEFSALAVSLWDGMGRRPVRGVGVRAAGLTPRTTWQQPDLFGEWESREESRRLDACVDGLRLRFGNHAVRRLSELGNPRLAQLDPERDHTVHPVSFFA